MGWFETVKEIYSEHADVMALSDVVKVLFGGALGALLNHRLGLARDRMQREQGRSERRCEAFLRTKTALISLRDSLAAPPVHDIGAASADGLPTPLGVALEGLKRKTSTANSLLARVDSMREELTPAKLSLERRRVSAAASATGGRAAAEERLENQIEQRKMQLLVTEESWDHARSQLTARIERIVGLIDRLLAGEQMDDEALKSALTA